MSSPLGMSIEAGDDRRPVVTVTGDLDFTTAAPLRATLADLLRGRPEVITLDFAGLLFIDSTGIALIVHTWQSGYDTGTSLRLRRAPRFLRTILDITGVGDLVDDPPGVEPERLPDISA